MLLADAGTPVTDLGAAPAQELGGRGQAAHPPGRERTKIGAFLAQSDAKGLKFMMIAFFHADHVISATIANLHAGRASFDAVLDVRIWRLFVVMHKSPCINGMHYWERKRQTTELSALSFR